jgi:hypothetical protein
MCRSTNSKPKCCAAATSADSSGDDAESLRSPSTVSLTTVWHSARWRKKSRHCASPPARAASSSGPSKLTSWNSPPLSPPLVSSTALCGACPSRLSRARPISVVPLPYATPAMAHLRNCITFCVSVPVLSEKTCDTTPSSSLSSVERTFIGVSLSGSYMSSDCCMKYVCPHLQIMIDTYRETETNVASVRKKESTPHTKFSLQPIVAFWPDAALFSVSA